MTNIAKNALAAFFLMSKTSINEHKSLKGFERRVFRLKYDMEVSLEKIRERSKKLKAEKQKKAIRWLSALSLLIFCVLTVTFYSIADILGTDAKGTYYGAFLISKEIGAFVLIGVAAFVTGVCITIILNRKTVFGEAFNAGTDYGGREDGSNDQTRS